MAEITQNGRLLKVHTPLPFDVLLIDSLSGFEAISQPFRFDAELLADVTTGLDQQVVPDKLVGHDVSVEIDVCGKRRFINGVLRSLTSKERRDRFATYQAEITPWFSLLALTANCRIFQNQTVPEIIAAVVSERGFSQAFRNDLSRTYTLWDYCVQYRETDLAFLSRLMEAEGISYYFEHNEDGTHTMVLTDWPDGFKSCPVQSSFRFNPEVGVGEFEDTIEVWQVRQEMITSKWDLRDYHFEMPTNKLEAPEKSVFANQVNSGFERFDFPGEYAKKFNQPEKRLGSVGAEGEKHVRMRMEQEETHYKTVQGLSGCRTFSSGHKFTVTGLATAESNGS
jgi:type VI secretion system secreted protein VgrG